MRARLQAAGVKRAAQEHQLQQLMHSGTPRQAQMQEKITGLERDLAATQERLLQLEGHRPAPKAEAPPAGPIKEVPPPAPAPAADPFQEGMSLYKQKSYGPARDKLQQYLKEQPKGAKVVEARYYLADSLLQEKQYDEAIVEFNKIVENHPKSPLAPAALLKQAQAFKAQGKAKIHGLVLEKLIADYPQSPEAAQARKLQGEAAATPDKKKGR